MLVAQLTLLLLGTEYGQPLADGFGSKASSEPFPDFALGVLIDKPETLDSLIQNGSACLFGRQRIGLPFICVISVELFYELPIFPGIRARFPQDPLPAFATQFN